MGERERFPIQGMTCANCVRHVTDALQKVDGVQVAKVNLATESAMVVSDAPIDRSKIVAAVEGAGYRVGKQEGNPYRNALIVSTAAGIPLVAYMMLLMPFGITLPYETILVVALASIIQFGPGSLFLKGALRALKAKDATMDTLVALGSYAAFLLSAYILYAGGHIHTTYFEASGGIIALVTLGKFLEARAKHRASETVRSILDQGLTEVEVVRTEDGSEVTQTVDPYLLEVGQVLRLRPGQTCPVDGTVVAGKADGDASAITGESTLIPLSVGQTVRGGTILHGGSLDVRVDATSEDSTLAMMARLVEEANESRAPLQDLADRISRVFVPTILVLSTLTLLYWLDRIGFESSLIRAVTVLVVACPCAMGLATPAAMMVASGRGASKGILIRNGESLDELARMDLLALDKTGTLTTGMPSIDRITVPESEWAAMAGLEAKSEHPLARSIVSYVRSKGIQPAQVESFQAIPGHGVEGIVDGVQIRVLRNETAGVDVLRDGQLVGNITFMDTLRPGVKRLVQTLRDQGVEPILISGDDHRNVSKMAKQLGLSEFHARQRPEQKAELLRMKLDEGHIVGMTGDGVNDGGALATASVGIAMGGGTDLAREVAGVILMEDDLEKIPEAIHLARRANRTMRQNLVWALIYNLSLIPIAMGALLPIGIQISPIFAAGAMGLSSVSVLANSLRLRSA